MKWGGAVTSYGLQVGGVAEFNIFYKEMGIFEITPIINQYIIKNVKEKSFWMHIRRISKNQA